MHYPFKNIVISGGGGKMVCIGGTLLELERRNILSNLERYAGTSSGSLLATALCLGYTGKEIHKILLDLDMSEFINHSLLHAKEFYRLYNKYGYSTGDTMMKFIKHLISTKTHRPNITFKELHALNHKELILTTVNLSKDKTMYCSRHTTPDMPIALAVRASMAAPFLYTPVIYKGDYLCDGGLTVNYPIKIFDGNYPSDIYNENKPPTNETLGLQFMSDDILNNIMNTPINIRSVVSYTHSVLSHVMNHISRANIYYDYGRTIPVPSGKIGMLDLKPSMSTKIKLQLLSQKKAKQSLDQYDKTREFTVVKNITSNI